MSKTLRKKGSEMPGVFERLTNFFKKQSRILLKSGRPYLKPRYWVIYAAAFSLGFYLWGPAHGLTKVRNWGNFRTGKTSDAPTIETLHREIELLKQMIKTEKLRDDMSISKFNPNSFSRPALGEIIQGFEWIKTNEAWRLHPGIDIGMPLGSSIMASAEGVVKEISSTPEEGIAVILEHGNGWESVYGNLEEVTVKEGDRIIKGMIIGTSGATSCNSKNPGFHFGINHNQKPVNPENIINGLVK
ncbi:MAG: peptidoglycan DD-metalloendopeptidase family protein [Bacteroidota bacterium]